MSQRNESPGIINADKSIDCCLAEGNVDEELQKQWVWLYPCERLHLLNGWSGYMVRFIPWSPLMMLVKTSCNNKKKFVFSFYMHSLYWLHRETAFMKTTAFASDVVSKDYYVLYCQVHQIFS